MASNPAPGGGNNIIINIITDPKKFLADVKTALNTAVNTAKQAGQQMSAALGNAFQNAISGAKQFNIQATLLGIKLVQNQIQYDALTKAGKGYLDLANQLINNSQQQKADFSQLQNLAAEYGVSLQRAGKIAIETGKMDIEAVQGALAANGRIILSKQELITVLENLQKNIERVQNGEELLEFSANKTNDTFNKQGKVAEQNAGIFSFLANRIKAVVTSLIVAGITYKFIQFLQDLLKESTAVSQSMFNFETAVKASQKVLGYAAGSVKDWEDTIKRLGKELKVFSERDIRDATTQVINLTKVLNLSKSDIEDIIKVSAALAETTGVDLNQAVSDVVHALGGSRVVLDKYGLFIRDADLRTQSMTDGLGSNTAALTSQQLALVTLHEILRQTGPLISSIGDYENNLAGQVKSVESDIVNSKDNIALELGELDLFFKNLYADFVDYIAQKAAALAPLMAFIKQFNLDQQSNSSAPKPPNIDDFITSPDKNVTASAYFQRAGMRSNTGGVYDRNGDFIEGAFDPNMPALQQSDVEELKAYTTAFQAWLAEYNKWLYMKEHADQFNQTSSNIPGFMGVPQGPTAPATPAGLSEKEQQAQDDFTQGIDDLLLDRNRKLEDAFTKYKQDYKDLFDDEIDAYATIGREFLRDLEDINTKTAQDIADAGTKLKRSMADVDIEESNKLQQIEKEKNDKLVEIKNDYYDALKELDREYYFDLFDASANNDAVALKNAERKYNLEKAKLKDKLDDDTEKTNKGAKDSVEALKKETAARKAELQLRYQQELEDIKLEDERKKKQLDIERAREKADTKKHYDDLKAQLKERYNQEKAQIDLDTARRYNDMVADFQAELTANKKHADDLIAQWDSYFDDLLKLEQDYKDEREKMNNPDDGGTDPSPLPRVCPVGQHYDPTTQKCVNDHNNPDPQASFTDSNNVGNNSNPNVHTIILTSDGSVSDESVERVAAELAGIFENIVTRKGNAE